MDLLSHSNPVDSRGYKYILAIEESYSRYCIFIPLKTISAKIIADAFMNRYIAFLAIPTLSFPIKADSLHLIYVKNCVPVYKSHMISLPKTHTAQTILKELLESLGKCLEL